jgi:general secretion pathway protein D
MTYHGNFVYGRWIWIGFFLFAMGLGPAGCSSGRFWNKPYTSPSDSEENNPFLRIKIPDTKPTDSADAQKAGDQLQDGVREKTGISQNKDSLPAKHIANQDSSIKPVWGARPAKDEKEAARLVHVELAFDNADLYEVLNLTLYELFGVSYMVDPTLKTTVSFHIVGDYTKDQFINALNQALQLNNLSIVWGSGNIYKIMPGANSAGSGAAPVTVSDEAGLSGDITRLIRLRYLSVATAIANITPFLTKGAPIIQDAMNNALLITDTVENISKAASILGLMDVEYFSDVSWQIFPLKEVDFATIAADAGLVQMAKGFLNRKGVVEGTFEVFPIKSMNAILVVTRWPSILTAAQEVITALDHFTDSEDNVHVYFVQNASALELSDILKQLFAAKSSANSPSNSLTGRPNTAGSNTGTQTTPGAPAQNRGKTTRTTGSDSGKRTGTDSFSGIVEITPDEANNAIVFKANNRDYKRIEAILKQLDIQPRQVLINVLVAEITLSGSVSYGIEWFLNKNIGSLGGSSGDYTAQGALDNKTTRPINTALGTANGFFLSIYDPVDFLTGLVNALGSDSDVNILSSPNILALDNKEAVIEVGQDVPTVTGTTTSAVAGSTVTNTVQYRKTGILLTVTPHINSSGLVKMELIQEVSDLGDFNTSLNNYIFLTRRADTSLVVEDNQTVVMAGLMKSNKKNSQSGIPYLKDIPVLGYLFGGVSKETTKTELIIMITPHVIKNRIQADEITREFSQKVKDLQAGGSKK